MRHGLKSFLSRKLLGQDEKKLVSGQDAFYDMGKVNG
jgi:hypothetical protein